MSSRANDRTGRFSLLTCLLLIIAIAACEEKEVGCLDLNATNFDVSADESGECVYPTLTFELLHIYLEDSITFRLGDTYGNDIHPAFRVTDLQFYLSGFAGISASGERYTIDEQITFSSDLPTGPVTIERPDDPVLVNPGRISYALGTYRYPGSYDGLELQAGLDSLWEHISIDDEIPDGHPIRNGGMEDDQTGTKFDLVFSILPDTGQVGDTVLVESQLDIPARIYNYSFDIDRGKNILIRWKVDYYTLFFGIDFENDTRATIREKLETNLYNAIRLVN